MFDKPEVDSYRQITAPQSLKAKVMAQCETVQPVRRLPYRIAGIAAAAACFLLVAVGVLLGRPAPEAVITMGGSPLTSEAVFITPDESAPMAVSARIIPPVTAVISVESDKAVDVAASAGLLMIYSDPAGTLITSGTDCTAEGSLRIEWTVFLMPGESETITIAGREFTLTQTNDGSTICETTSE